MFHWCSASLSYCMNCLFAAQPHGTENWGSFTHMFISLTCSNAVLIQEAVGIAVAPMSHVVLTEKRNSQLSRMTQVLNNSFGIRAPQRILQKTYTPSVTFTNISCELSFLTKFFSFEVTQTFPHKNKFRVLTGCRNVRSKSARAFPLFSLYKRRLSSLAASVTTTLFFYSATMTLKHV